MNITLHKSYIDHATFHDTPIQYLTVLVKDIRSSDEVDVFSTNFDACGLEAAIKFVQEDALPEVRKHVRNRGTRNLTMKQAMLDALGKGFLEARDEGNWQEMEILALTIAEVLGKRLFMIVEDASRLKLISSMNTTNDTMTPSETALIASALASLTPAELAKI